MLTKIISAPLPSTVVILDRKKKHARAQKAFLQSVILTFDTKTDINFLRPMHMGDMVTLSKKEITLGS
jgi:hypothetical protein